jgi:Domain of unknown function (DUF1877)
MGVCFVAFAVSDHHIAEILADPPLVWRVLDAEDDRSYLRELSSGDKPSLLEKLLGRTPPPPRIPRRLTFADTELKTVDLDKCWDLLNAALKLCAPDAPNFFEASGDVGRVDVGYGPAGYHRSEVMSRIAVAYLAVSEQAILEALRTADLKGVYRREIWEQPDAVAIDYVTEHFKELQAFVRHTADHSLGAILQST